MLNKYFLCALALCAAPVSPAAAALVTFTYHGTVASFIDTNDVFGFGAGANLAGLSVTDTYVVDTSSGNSSFSSGPFGVGGNSELWNANLPAGLSMASSTIDGHTLSVNDNVFNTSLQYVDPPAPYDESAIESQGIGFETTGTAIGSEFLIRDEALSYSLVIPLSLTTSYYLDQSLLQPGTNGGIYSGVFLPYAQGSAPGYFDMTSISVNGGVPEPSTWGLMLVGFAGLGLAGYRAAKLRRTEERSA